jgi:anaerobic ribonucleoside-triphosphate reductase activating protein
MKVLTITTPDVENGLGCRVTIWVAGCSRHCPGCHNPHTWKYNQGSELLSDEVLDKIFYEAGFDYIQGITLSGGDPLDQDEASLIELLTFIKQFKLEFPDKDIWIYSGGTYEQLMENDIIREILLWCDVLVDGPFIQDKKVLDLAFRGSTNQRIIDLNKTFINDIVEIPVE